MVAQASQLITLLSVWLLLTRTRLGLFVRAVTQNRQRAAGLGVPTPRIDLLAFALKRAGMGGGQVRLITDPGFEQGGTACASVAELAARCEGRGIPAYGAEVGAGFGERIATLEGEIYELAEEEVARAHHGSLAREQRLLIEEDLKGGRLPAVVANAIQEKLRREQEAEHDARDHASGITRVRGFR